MDELGKLLTVGEVAAYLRRDEGTLNNWRWAKKGPPWVKVCGRPMYPVAGLKAWIEENTENPSEKAVAQ